MKTQLIFTSMLLAGTISFAQTAEELKAKQAPKKDSIAKLQAEVDALQAQIDALPGWKTGAFGTIGFSLSEFNNWYAQGSPNVSSGNIGFTVNGFANLQREKFFWRNAANVNLTWVKFDDKDVVEEEEGFREATDVFNISSLYGRRLSEKWAISGLAEYRTTILNNFNDPGYLDVGVGATWTPIDNLIVTIHPLNYNFVFADEDTVFNSSLGAKVFADYTRQIGQISFKSNLSLFQSYEESDYSNWTWINSFGYTLWKSIGVGFDFGLRSNTMEALNFALDNFDPVVTPSEPEPSFDNVDNDLQTYWLLGLNYSF